MVFTRLDDSEKHAFFELLDEYFSSRPDLFSPQTDPSDSTKATNDTNNVQQRAASAVTRALAANPEATATLISSGLRHSAAANANSANASAGGTRGAQSSVMSAASNPEVANSVGRVAAAALAFSQNKSPSPSGKPAPPPPPAHRAPSFTARSISPSSSPSHIPSTPPPPAPPAPAPPPPPPTHALPSHKPATTASGLTSSKSFGNIDTTSFSRSVISMATKSKPPPQAAPQKPAFPKKVGGFAPPPVRRTTSSDGTSGGGVTAPSPAPPPLPRRSIVPEPEPEPEPEVWGEALYDYESEEPGDLQLRAKQHVKILERDSDDWWTGEVNGKTGLFPAAYVKLL